MEWSDRLQCSDRCDQRPATDSRAAAAQRHSATVDAQRSRRRRRRRPGTHFHSHFWYLSFSFSLSLSLLSLFSLSKSLLSTLFSKVQPATLSLTFLYSTAPFRVGRGRMRIAPCFSFCDQITAYYFDNIVKQYAVIYGLFADFPIKIHKITCISAPYKYSIEF